MITDFRKNTKYTVNDFLIHPHLELTLGLPPFFTAITDMDALSHAVEAISATRTAGRPIAIQK